jgi:peroxiredoxin
LQLSDFKGKPLLLNLFGPWCPECIEKMSELVKLHEQYAKKGVIVLAICRGGDTREAQAYLKDHKLPFPIVSDADGFAVDFFRPGHAEPSYPTNVLLDTKGKRILRQVGFGGDNVNILRSTIEHLLNENQSRQD